MAAKRLSIYGKRRTPSGKFAGAVFCCARPQTRGIQDELDEQDVHDVHDIPIKSVDDAGIVSPRSSIFSDISSIFNSSSWGLRSIRSFRLRQKGHPWNLPPSILGRILSISPARSVAACACVCSAWRKSANAEGIRDAMHLERILCYENLMPTVVTTNEDYTRTSGRVGDLIALGGQGFLSIWHLGESDLAVRCFDAEKLSIRALVFTKGLLLTGDDDGNLCGWDYVSGELKFTEPVYAKTVSSIVDLNKRVALTGGGTSEVLILDKSDWSGEKVLKGHKDGVSCWGSACSGARIVFGCFVGSIRVWDVGLGKCVMTLLGHRKAVNCVDSYGNYLASGSNDCTVRIWDLSSGECVSILEGHHHWVRAVSLHRCFVVSGSQDKTVRVSNFMTGDCLLLVDVGSLAKAIWMDDEVLVVVTSDSQIVGWKFNAIQC